MADPSQLPWLHSYIFKEWSQRKAESCCQQAAWLATCPGWGVLWVVSATPRLVVCLLFRLEARAALQCHCWLLLAVLFWASLVPCGVEGGFPGPLQSAGSTGLTTELPSPSLCAAFLSFVSFFFLWRFDWQMAYSLTDTSSYFQVDCSILSPSTWKIFFKVRAEPQI